MFDGSKILNLLGGVKCYLSLFEKCVIDLDRNDSAMLKALAIIMVVFHNYWHNVFGAPEENEQYFRSGVIRRVWSALIDNPVDFIHPLASFFGHYGVHVFIFLSGYGLTKKLILMSKSGQNEMWCLSGIYRDVVIKQIFKIFKLILVGLIFLCLIRGCQLGDFLFINKAFLKDFIVFCTFTQNFRPNQIYAFCTVWWFLSLIVQLYVLFPFMVRIVRRAPEKSIFILLILTLVCGLLSNTITNKFHIYIFSTPFAHALIFAFGIYCAMGRRVSKIVFLVAFIVFPLSWKFRLFFPFSFISAVLIVLYLAQRFKQILSIPPVIYIGNLSMFIYITHGDIRWPLLQAVNQSHNLFVAYAMFFGYVVLCFFVAWLCRTTARAMHLLK